jgi:hypothetical protein
MNDILISTVPNELPKMIAEKAKKIVSKIVSAYCGQLLSVFVASGLQLIVPPAMAFLRKTKCDELYSEAPIGNVPLKYDTGYMIRDLFLQCLHPFQIDIKAMKTDSVIL